MAIVVNSNVPSVHAGRALAANRLDLEKAMERLSSGKRLNSSRDDAAGMSVVTLRTERKNKSKVDQRDVAKSTKENLANID